jgi:hypothetical protein
MSWNLALGNHDKVVHIINTLFQHVEHAYLAFLGTLGEGGAPHGPTSHMDDYLAHYLDDYLDVWQPPIKVGCVMSPFWDIITLQYLRVLCLPE